MGYCSSLECQASQASIAFGVSLESRVETYIGECDDLHHRVHENHANPLYHGKIAARIRNWLLSHLEGDPSVDLSIATSAVLGFDDESVPADMSDMFVRLLVERAGMVLAQRSGDVIQNLR